MSVVRWLFDVADATVVETKAQFDEKGGFHGSALRISPFQREQFDPEKKDTNTSYDLRVGSAYKDHRGDEVFQIDEKQEIDLLPGMAVLVRTKEQVMFPDTMFGYVVPKVRLLQKGVSNTLSKVDPGYNGCLVVTLFNLGKKNVKISRDDPFCSLVLHRVDGHAQPYEKGSQELEGKGRLGWKRSAINWIDAHPPLFAGGVALLVSPWPWHGLFALVKFGWRIFHG